MTATYDRIGSTYATYRRPDPRISAVIEAALGDATTVLDVGAGAGSYELGDRRYIAVEPSQVMLGQRAPDAAPAVRGVAEQLPFPDNAFDAAMAILTMHHWPDAAHGLAEVRRVTRGPIVVLTWDAELFAGIFWLVRDYLPESALQELPLVTLTAVRSILGTCRVEPVLVPHDCTDGFFAAYWRRPERYLEPGSGPRSPVSRCSTRPWSTAWWPSSAPTWPADAGTSVTATCSSWTATTTATGS